MTSIIELMTHVNQMLKSGTGVLIDGVPQGKVRRISSRKNNQHQSFIALNVKKYLRHRSDFPPKNRDGNYQGWVDIKLQLTHLQRSRLPILLKTPPEG